LLAALERIMSLSQREQKQKESGQSSMFDLFGQNVSVPLPALNLDQFDVNLQEKLIWEKELMGVYFSEHPLAALASKLAEYSSVLCGEINADMAGEKVVVAGMVTAVRIITTKNNRLFVVATFEDLNGSIEVTVWQDVYQQSQDLWIEGSILVIEGTVKVRDDRVSVNCTRVHKYDPDMNKVGNGKATYTAPPQKLKINIEQTEDTDRDLANLQKILEILRKYPGKDTVQLTIRKNDKITRMDLPDLRVDCCNDLIKELSQITQAGANCF
jgi:DNA polymerase-3 subunit alpha